ncbi:hypothetical protein E4U41_004730, partial [Claviceps citrina]
DLEHKVQVLDEVLTNLWTLSDPAGRYARLVRRFGRFLDGACDAEEARRAHDNNNNNNNNNNNKQKKKKGGVPPPDAVLLADELDASWKDEAAALTRRLEMWDAQFSEVDDADDGVASSPPAALGRMLRGARDLLRGMLAELYAMREMEGLALAREEAWMERVNGEAGGGEGEGEGVAAGVGAVWRVL